jgi:hypothetical protein
MLYRKALAASVLLLSCLIAAGKDKKKVVLPVYVLQAHTVFVIVDPTAGVSVEDPNANRIARADVENALAKWGRLTPVASAYQADLIITVRKGNGKMVEPTIGGTPINSPPPVIAQRTDSGINAAGRAGNSGIPGDASDTGPSTPHPQMEVAPTQDMFVVYRGDPNHDGSANPLDSPPVWRYYAKDALESPSVPAVDVFRKLIAQAEKQQAGTP